MRDENFHLAHRFILHRHILLQVLFLILLVGSGVAQSTPTTTPTPDGRSLEQAQRDNQAAQADYYRAQLQKLNSPNPPKTFWQTLSENAAVLGALTAAFVAVFSLILNQRFALRARKDTEFYEALKRFGDKDSPTVRASAATILAQMTKTKFLGWRWQKDAPWWRPDRKMTQHPYFETVLDQLITALLLEENKVVYDKILSALEQSVPNNIALAARQLYRQNMKLQSDIAESLNQYLVGRGAASVDFNEWQPFLKEAGALTDCSEPALEFMYSTFRTGSQSFATTSMTFSVMDDTQKRASLMEIPKTLAKLGNRLQLNVRLWSTILSARPETATTTLKLKEMYLENALLIGANLQNVLFEGALMKGAWLSNSKLKGASFVGADLRDTWFNRADLTNTKFAFARFTVDCNFEHTNWWRADIGSSGDGLLFVVDNLKDKQVTQQMLNEAHPSMREYVEHLMKAG
jgi:hypothetical protein